MSRRPMRTRLGNRAPIVFERYLSGDGENLHPDDRTEASAFVAWLDQFERPPEADARASRANAYAAVAALVLFTLMASGLWVTLGWRASTPASEAFETYAAGHGENRQIVLNDGSKIDLAAESRVDVAFTSAERRLILRSGEAFFTVAHNRQRPFIVSAANGEVRALGTSFNIRLNPASTQVTIVEGVVQIDATAGDRSAPGRRATVRAGQQIDYGVRREAAQLSPYLSPPVDVDPGDVTAWKRGLLVFRGAPLIDVVAVANRYATRTISLDDPNKATIPVFGIFRVGETEEIEAIAKR